MLHLKNGILIFGLPLAFSLATVIGHSVVMLILYILVHFLILKLTPAFKHLENIGMFLIVSFSSIPINVYVFKILTHYEILFNSFIVVNVLRGMLFYIVLLSVEEIIMGVLTRWIWKKQYKFTV